MSKYLKYDLFPECSSRSLVGRFEHTVMQPTVVPCKRTEASPRGDVAVATSDALRRVTGEYSVVSSVMIKSASNLHGIGKGNHLPIELLPTTTWVPHQVIRVRSTVHPEACTSR